MSNVTTFPNAYEPTKAEIRSRHNLFVQLGRFAALNLKMLAMVRKGHH